MLLLKLLPAFPTLLLPRQQNPTHRPPSSLPRPFPSFAAIQPLQHPPNPNIAETTTSFDEEGYELPELDFSAERDTKHFPSPEVEVIQLEDLPDQWKRARIAWLCKELPAHKQGTLVRILNAQRKWIRQADATYVVVHCMRVRENEAAYKVYSWMTQQHWFHFDFALATKLTDFLGKDRKFLKCREMFDSMIKQGRVPSEATFHILTVAYLSAPIEGCVEEACFIYNKMIQIGGYMPRLSLHNSLFRALLGQPRRVSKHHLKQAEFIYHNLLTSDFEVHKDIFAGLIWLHSYQESIDRDRIDSLRDEMKRAKIEEDKDILISILRACSKLGDVEEAEKTWLKLLASGHSLPSQAFVYRMELYSKAGDPMKSLEIFNEMKRRGLPVNVASYHKIIEVMTHADELDVSEALVDEFTERGMKSLNPAFHDLMKMYLKLGMHDKLEATFSKCLAKSHPSRSVHGIYLESLVMVNDLEKAEQIFNEMQTNGTIGAGTRSCNVMLQGYLAAGDYANGVKVYDMMIQKKYDVEPEFQEQMEQFLDQNKKLVRKSVSLKLNGEQREILIGLLLGGAEVMLDEEKGKHAILFEFNSSSDVHSALKIHIHERFYEWLTSPNRSLVGEHEIPHRFCTVAHSSFSFFADQFRVKNRPVVPKLVHRWLSARVLAYWYMYCGFKTSSDDILLKLRGASLEDIEKIVKFFQKNGMASKVKRKGRISWIGFQGRDAAIFWKVVEPFILQNVKDFLMPHDDDEGPNSRVDIGSDSDVSAFCEKLV